MGFDLNQALRDMFGSNDPMAKPLTKRERYQEALITELLRTLTTNGIITTNEAQAVIRRAHASVK